VPLDQLLKLVFEHVGLLLHLDQVVAALEKDAATHGSPCSSAGVLASPRPSARGCTNTIFPAKTPIQPPRLTLPRTGLITPKDSEVDRGSDLPFGPLWLGNLPLAPLTF
jgi:hypothetical protein